MNGPLFFLPGLGAAGRPAVREARPADEAGQGVRGSPRDASGKPGGLAGPPPFLPPGFGYCV